MRVSALILNKLDRLRQALPTVLIRYTCMSRMMTAGVFRLADVRMQLLQFGGGVLKLHSAAPIVCAHNATPHVKFTANTVYKVLLGEHKGILLQQLPDPLLLRDMVIAPAPRVGSVTIDLNSADQNIELAAAMAKTPYIPISRIILPVYVRIARHMSSLRPRITALVVLSIGSDAQTILLKICTTGLDGSIVAPFLWIYSGGLCAVHPSIVDRRAVNNIFGMSLLLFKLQMPEYWDLELETPA